MDNTFVDMGSEFLAHHGVDGQKWGVQNGPPYPLNSEGKEALREQRKQAKKEEKASKKEAARKTAILRDPKKIIKFQDELTKEEIDDALAKIQSLNRVKDVLPKKSLALTKEQKQWAKDPMQMIKNFDKFKPEQLKLAMEAQRNYQSLQDAKLTKANMPKKWLDLGIGYLKSFTDAGSSILKARDMLLGFGSLESGLTSDQSYKAKLLDKKHKFSDGTEMSYYEIFNGKPGKGGGGPSKDAIFDKIRSAPDMTPEKANSLIEELKKLYK